VSSVVLVANGASFAVMTALFTTIGSAADYGSFGRWLLFGLTVICWGAQFGSMSLTSEYYPFPLCNYFEFINSVQLLQDGVSPWPSS